MCKITSDKSNSEYNINCRCGKKFNSKDTYQKHLLRKKKTQGYIYCEYLLTNAEDWKKSFKNNKNTGVNYEIDCGLELLNISNVVGLYNYTQDDSVAGTGDLGILFNNNNFLTYSITALSVNKKCLKNPSATKTYNLKNTEELKKMNEEAFREAIKYRKDHKGSEPNQKWKRCKKCPGTRKFTEHLAKLGSNAWNEMTENERVSKLKFLLDVNPDSKTNATGIIHWNKKNKCIEKMYKWNFKTNVLMNYLNTTYRGCYIYHGTPEDHILKIQTKYNNGIIEGLSSKLDPKDWNPTISNNYLSSWNANCNDISKFYELESQSI